MTPDQSAMLGELAQTLDAKTIVTDPALIAPWETDWRDRYHGRSPALLAPATTADVATMVRAAARHRVPLVPQGGNSSMVGGATPSADGTALLLSLRRLDRIRSLDPDAGFAVVEAGVVLQRLHDAAIASGRRFPLTLGARGSATIGGLVSTNAGGTQVLRFGSMRGLVAGIEAVLANGQVLDDLSPLKKDNRGYDLTQLMIGAEGTLGVVTAATLRLAPLPPTRAAAWAGSAGPDAALALLRRFQHASEALESFEIMPRESLEAVLDHVPGTRNPLAGEHRWHLLIETTDERGAALLEDQLGAALADGLIEDAVVAASDAQIEAFWRIRDSISDSERARGPASQHDLSVPVGAMPRFMVEAAAACEARFPGTHASGFGHLGDGNIHFHVRAAAGADPARWYDQDVPAVTRFVDDLVVAAGGSIAAEHGIGQMKSDELARLASPARLSALRAVKAGLDPLGILNPGKLVSLAPADASQ